MQRKLYRWAPSLHCEDHPWLRPRMESRMRGNSHVRFGAGDEETCPGNGARRFIPTLPENPPPSHSTVPPRDTAGPGSGAVPDPRG